MNVHDHWGGEALLGVYLVHFGDVKACRTPLKEVKVVAETSVHITLQLMQNIGLQNSGKTSLVDRPNTLLE